MRRPKLLSVLLLASCLACAIGVPNATAQSETDFFESEIRPLLVAHCLKCHGPEKQESELRLDAPQHWTKGGLGGPAIVPGKPQSSLLLRAVRKTDPDLQMPPGKKKLSPQEIASLEKWIKAGAIAVAFDHTGGGLMIGKPGVGKVTELKEGTLNGFEMANKAGAWHAAKAVIQGKNVVVRSNAVKRPAAVRYACHPQTTKDLPWNLYNMEGLPASPFCSDWSMMSYNPRLNLPHK